MTLASRLYVAAGIAAVLNSICWAISKPVRPEHIEAWLVVVIAVRDTILRVPLDLAAGIFVFLPITTTMGARSAAGKTIIVLLASGAGIGLLVGGLIRNLSFFPGAGVIWWSGSFVVSAIVWSALAVAVPVDLVASGWRSSANVAVDAVRPTIWRVLAGGCLAYYGPIIVVALMFLGYTLLS